VIPPFEQAPVGTVLRLENATLLLADAVPLEDAEGGVVIEPRLATGKVMPENADLPEMKVNIERFRSLFTLEEPVPQPVVGVTRQF
jgi:hypothetical protein